MAPGTWGKPVDGCVTVRRLRVNQAIGRHYAFLRTFIFFAAKSSMTSVHRYGIMDKNCVGIGNACIRSCTVSVRPNSTEINTQYTGFFFANTKIANAIYPLPATMSLL